MILTASGITVQFPRPHATPYEQSVRFVQPHDFSLGGVFYLYDRGVRLNGHRLIWTFCPVEVRDAVISLFDTTLRGQLHPLTWKNPLWGERTCYLDGTITYREPLPGRFTIAMSLYEIVTAPVDGLLDSSGDNLLDSDGNIILGM